MDGGTRLLGQCHSGHEVLSNDVASRRTELWLSDTCMKPRFEPRHYYNQKGSCHLEFT